jgi:hypothetical protein
MVVAYFAFAWGPEGKPKHKIVGVPDEVRTQHLPNI